MAVTRTVLVPFYDDFINAFQDETGEVWALLCKCCKAIGLNVEIQRRRLRAERGVYLTGRKTCRVAGSCNARAYTVIAARSIGPWLTDIESEQVRPEARPKLERYRDEAGDALYAHFQGRPASLPEKQPVTPSELVEVPFHGGVLDAVQDPDGQVQAGIRTICTRLGLGYSKQLQRLKKSKFATVSMRYTVAADGRIREIAMVDIESVPLWLGQVQAWRVSDDVRAKIELYQKEVKDVLAAHFLRRKAPPLPAAGPVPARPGVSGETVDRALATVAAFVTQSNKANEAGAAALAVVRDLVGAHLLATTETAAATPLVETRAQLAAALTRLAAVEVTAALALQAAQAATVRAGGDLGWTTLVDYYRRKNITLAAGSERAMGRVLTARMEAAGTLPRQVADPRHPKWHVNQYPARLLDDYYDELAGRPLPTDAGGGA